MVWRCLVQLGVKNKDLFDVAILISNDSDLALPLKIVREQFKKQIYVINPHKTQSGELSKNSDRCRPLRKGNLIASQLENPMSDKVGVIYKPASWS